MITQQEAQTLIENITDFADAYKTNNVRLIAKTQQELQQFIQSIVEIPNDTNTVAE